MTDYRTEVARALDEALASGDPERIAHNLAAYTARQSGAEETAWRTETARQSQTTFTPVEDADSLDAEPAERAIRRTSGADPATE